MDTCGLQKFHSVWKWDTGFGFSQIRMCGRQHFNVTSIKFLNHHPSFGRQLLSAVYRTFVGLRTCLLANVRFTHFSEAFPHPHIFAAAAAEGVDTVAGIFFLIFMFGKVYFMLFVRFEQM